MRRRVLKLPGWALRLLSFFFLVLLAMLQRTTLDTDLCAFMRQKARIRDNLHLQLATHCRFLSRRLFIFPLIICLPLSTPPRQHLLPSVPSHFHKPYYFTCSLLGSLSWTGHSSDICSPFISLRLACSCPSPIFFLWGLLIYSSLDL